MTELALRARSAAGVRLMRRFSPAVMKANRASWAALWVAAAAGTAGSLALFVVQRNLPVDPVQVVLRLVGASFAACGLVAWRRRPDNRSGLLMTLAGFAVFLVAGAGPARPPRRADPGAVAVRSVAALLRPPRAHPPGGRSAPDVGRRRYPQPGRSAESQGRRRHRRPRQRRFSLGPSQSLRQATRKGKAGARPRMSDQLPAIVAPGTVDQSLDSYVVPALIADLGDAAAWRYVEFFTANIRNPHTRRAYARACSRFFAWCEDRGLTPATIRPHDVATYIEQLQHQVSAPSVKQQLAAIRMLFDWLVIGQIVPNNPAAAVRGPEACRQDRQDAGARSRVAQAAQIDPDRRRCAICATGR